MTNNLEDFKYCVAIRTLGLAGNKFQQELNSLINQTIPPQKIIVYIAEGYEIPEKLLVLKSIYMSPKA